MFSTLAFLAILSFALAVDPRCSGVPSGEEYLFPYPGNCTRYIHCTTSGDAENEVCLDGLWFNEALQGCDHPDSSGCVPLTCPPGIVDYYRYPGDCTRYIECYRGTSEVHSCPEDLYFNPTEKRCTSVGISGCGEYATTVEPPWTTPSDLTCYGVIPGAVVLKPYPGDCNRLIECIGSSYSILSCPTGLYFDKDRQMCDQPELANCDATTGSPDPNTTPNPSTVGPLEDPRCVDQNTDYWPDVECHRYIECYKGLGYVMYCPSGLYFNENEKKCEDPRLSNCGRITETPDPNTTLPPNQDPDCPFPTPDRYLFPYPGDCTRFLECITGVKVVQDCPDDLWFNPTLEVCDYPYSSGCTQYNRKNIF